MLFFAPRLDRINQRLFLQKRAKSFLRVLRWLQTKEIREYRSNVKTYKLNKGIF